MHKRLFLNIDWNILINKQRKALPNYAQHRCENKKKVDESVTNNEVPAISEYVIELANGRTISLATKYICLNINVLSIFVFN